MSLLKRPLAGQLNGFAVRLFLTGDSRIRFRDEILDSLLPLHDMRNNGAYAAADADELMSLDGSVTSQFNTQQPVHLASSFGRRGEVYIPRVGLGRFKCLLDGFVGRVR